MMVNYLPVKFEFNWSKRFRVRVRKQKCGQTDGRWTLQSNRWVGYTQPALKEQSTLTHSKPSVCCYIKQQVNFRAIE